MNPTPSARQRRYHPAEIKAQLITLCQQPGASVAGVALAHGVNANLLRRWIPSLSPLLSCNVTDDR
ncbi:MAG: transposase [Halothiobacillus sp.]|jgi:transposase-like protein|nr:transposase [Halothiobacillus sp.]MDY0146902.1 transposase [Halothiobacillus sp.]